MILGPAFRTQKQVGDAGVLPTNPLQKERMRPLAIRWCWTLLELLLQPLSPNNVALAYRQLFFHSAAAPQASSIASLPPCGKVTLWASDRMQCNARSIKGTSAWPAGLKCFFMLANTPALYAAILPDTGWSCFRCFDLTQAPMTCAQSATRSACWKTAFCAKSSPGWRSAWYCWQTWVRSTPVSLEVQFTKASKKCWYVGWLSLLVNANIKGLNFVRNALIPSPSL